MGASVRIRTEKGFRSEIKTGKHELIADEPESFGGGDEGPSPYDYLAAALGTCTTMTLRMYADRKKWPLDWVEVVVKHEKIHAEDCGHCETKEGKIDQLHRVITLAGPLGDDQRQRLMEIADKCPVHKTLTSEISVTSELTG